MQHNEELDLSKYDVKAICDECLYTLSDGNYCTVINKKVSVKNPMCIEGAEEVVRRLYIKMEAHEKNGKKLEKKILLHKAVQYQKHIVNLQREKSKNESRKLDDKIEDNRITYEDIDLKDLSKAEYYNKDLKVRCILMGKDHVPYIVPEEVQIICPNPIESSKKCNACVLMTKPITYRCNYYSNRKDLLEFIGINSNQLLGTLRKKIGIAGCHKSKIEIIKEQNIEELNLIPELTCNMVNYEYTIKRALYLGQGLKTNSVYEMSGCTLPDSKTQLAVFVVSKAEVTEDDIDDFRISEDVKNKLSKFKLKEGQTIKDKIYEIYTDFTFNIEPQIYGRKNLHFALDLVYHSVLSFKFLDQIVDRGWMEAMFIGDTRCGKTELVKKMITHYSAGEFITSGENTTLAGLVGGVQNNGNHWILVWGKWVLNNRRAITIDEADGIDPEILSKLSGLRSSGIAEIVKIRKEKTMAKTRVIWITNPQKGNLKRYAYGIEAIKEIFTRVQDISRLDFVVGVAKDDVPIEKINKRHHKSSIPHRYKKDMCHLLVMFAWSRRTDQIKFEKDAEDYILEQAIEFDKTYSYNIPLVTGAEMRIKLAKMSVSLAARLYNTDDSGEIIIVTKSIVSYVVSFLKGEYRRPSLDYEGYSEQKNKEVNLKSVKELEELNEWNIDHVTLFLNQNRLNIGDVQDILGLNSKNDAKAIIGKMVKLRALVKSYTFYLKTPAFIEWLKNKKDYLNDKGEEVVF